MSLKRGKGSPVPLARPEAGPSPGCPRCARPGRLHRASLSQSPPARRLRPPLRANAPFRKAAAAMAADPGSVAAARRLPACALAAKLARRPGCASRPVPSPPPPPPQPLPPRPAMPPSAREGGGRRAVGGPPQLSPFQASRAGRPKGSAVQTGPNRLGRLSRAAPLPRRSPRQSAGRPSPSLLSSPRASPLPPRPGLSPPDAWPRPHNPPLSP